MADAATQAPVIDLTISSDDESSAISLWQFNQRNGTDRNIANDSSEDEGDLNLAQWRARKERASPNKHRDRDAAPTSKIDPSFYSSPKPLQPQFITSTYSSTQQPRTGDGTLCSNCKKYVLDRHTQETLADASLCFSCRAQGTRRPEHSQPRGSRDIPAVAASPQANASSGILTPWRIQKRPTEDQKSMNDYAIRIEKSSVNRTANHTPTDQSQHDGFRASLKRKSDGLIKSSLPVNGPQTPTRLEPAPATSPLFCPNPSCSRGGENPFKAKWLLNEHLKLMHPQDLARDNDGNNLPVPLRQAPSNLETGTVQQLKKPLNLFPRIQNGTSENQTQDGDSASLVNKGTIAQTYPEFSLGVMKEGPASLPGSTNDGRIPTPAVAEHTYSSPSTYSSVSSRSPTPEAVRASFAAEIESAMVSATNAPPDELQNLVSKMKADIELDPSNIYKESEDRLLLYLKENCGLTWKQIYPYLPHRTVKLGLEVRYSSKLKKRQAPWQIRDAKPKYASQVRREAASATLKVRLKSSTVESKILTETNHGAQQDHEGSAGNTRRSSRLEGSHVSYSRYFPLTLKDPSFKINDTETSQGLRRVGSPAMEQPNSRLPSYPSTTSHVAFAQQSVTDTERRSQERARDLNVVSSLTETLPRSRTLDSHQHRERFIKSSSFQLKRLALAIQRPYLRKSERRFVQNQASWDGDTLNAWRGCILHAGFTEKEMENVARGLQNFLPTPKLLHLAPKEQLEALLYNCSQDQLRRWVLQPENRQYLSSRSPHSVQSFLEDIRNDSENTKEVIWLDSKNQDPSYRSTNGVGRLLRRRELGQRPLLADKCQATILSVRAAFHGTSGDAHALAWSNDGSKFAVGSTAITDSHSMQYNMPNNLLLGLVDDLQLLELPRHVVKRECPATGVNSLAAMRATQEPFLFTSVSSISFSSDSRQLYSTGYDHHLRVWNLQAGIATTEISRALHDGPVDVLSVSRTGIIATGAKTINNPLRMFKQDLFDESLCEIGHLSSKRAIDRKLSKMHPTALAFNESFHYLQGQLLCGFSSEDRDDGSGDAVVFDVERNLPYWIGGRSVFDVAWSPCTFGRFAVASVAGAQSNRGIKSIIRIFDSRYLHGDRSFHVNPRCTTELECPALDMNETRFNTRDPNLISVGCTDGNAYLWDLRMSNRLLHSFSHGPSLMPLDENRDREEVDTGVRFLSWDREGRHLYTGSSDGIVSAWDPYRSAPDCFVEEIARLNSGVMSGLFSPDYTSLLVGEVSSRFSMLSLSSRTIVEDEDVHRADFQLNEATVEKTQLRRMFTEMNDEYILSEESGVEIARNLVRSHQMQIRWCGSYPFRQAVQGENYSGPFNRSAEADDMRRKAGEFQAGLVRSETEGALDREVPKVTEEEFGDLELWKDRIPATARKQQSDTGKDMKCFRCGTANLTWLTGIHNKGDILQCGQCNLRWQSNVLGYSFLGNVNPNHRRSNALTRSIDQSTALDSGDGNESDPELGEIGRLHNLWGP